jgi:heterodisulfide reductase subunit B
MRPLPKPWERLHRRTWLDGSRIAVATNLGINTDELRCQNCCQSRITHRYNSPPYTVTNHLY